jgi:hypothetical protein
MISSFLGIGIGLTAKYLLECIHAELYDERKIIKRLIRLGPNSRHISHKPFSRLENIEEQKKGTGGRG